MIYSTTFPNAADEADKNAPEFIRLPAVGTRCRYTGLSRSGLNNLILPTAANGYKPPVRSVCVRRRGAVRGTRLVVYASLLEYLNSCLPTNPADDQTHDTAA